MYIAMTLSEVLERCNNWDLFCEEEGWSVWAVNEGGGDVQVNLTEEKAYKYGILKQDDN